MTTGKARIMPPLRPPVNGDITTLSINGQEVKIPSGSTVLEAAKSAGIKIPYMCILKDLSPYGACRLCIVEIEGRDEPVPSCSTYVEAGMRVTTDSERLSRLRHTYLELLLSDHNAYCLPPCKYGCPTRVDAPAFLEAISNDDYEEAQRVLKENLPFPAIVGRICPHPCEVACRRAEVEEPISIRLSHRHVGDVAIERVMRPENPAPPTGKRIAVIGAGPAGLANAYYLALKGHDVTIFEALPHPGGMLRYGIPEYRLPKALLDAELEPLWEMGVKLKTQSSLGPDYTVDGLLEEGFDAVFLSIGAHESRTMRVEGEELEGVYGVVEFLREVALDNAPDIGEKVVVVGGGFSAMDAARVSVRLGAKEVTVVYRRTQAEMPAHEIEVRDAMEEGVQFVYLANPVKVEGTSGRVTGVVLQKMELGEPDESGRRRPQPVPGSEYLMEVDTIVPAIGQMPKLTYTPTDGADHCNFLDEAETGVKCTKWQTISANPKTFQTDRPQVFTGGDAFTGAATVVAAIAAGKQAAWAMDAFLKGEDMGVYESSLPEYDVPPMLAIPAYRPEKEAREHPAHLSAQERKTNFNEVEQGLAQPQAQAEGKRCLQCICEGVETCKLRRYSVNMGLLKSEGNRFEGEQHLYGRDTRHPFIQRDPNRCIDCGRCVRVCKYWTGSGVYELTGRGPGTIAATAFDVPLEETDCVSCGRCAMYCPTGAIFMKVRVLKDWHLDTARCIFCADCVEVCPVGALDVTPNFELAAHRHEDLRCHLLEKALAQKDKYQKKDEA